jgi:hypothetical protein
MLGKKDRRQPELFVAGSLRELIPDDHILLRVDRVLDLSWLRAEVSELYSADNGRPGIDPEVAVRLMLAGQGGSEPSVLVAIDESKLAQPFQFHSDRGIEGM